jgi:hypothetical protein
MATTPRRTFLTSLAATAALGALPAPLAAEHATGPFDDSWTARVKAAAHKAVFDAPEANDGLALTQAWIYRRGFRDALGADGPQVVPVIVLRHQTAALALDDALWAKYQIGALRKIDDPTTKKPAERNPWSRTPAGTPPDADLAAILGGPVDPTLEGVIRSGGVVLVCNLALTRVAQSVAKKNNLDAAAVLAEFRAGLVPGVVVQPSGIYAAARAQEAGCVFMRST